MEDIFESLKTFIMTEEDWSRHPIVSENSTTQY
jgi:hypothetical protein